MLHTLELSHIRSYDNGLFEFQGGVNIIVGPNASGKTNLLESIHCVATGSGFRSSDNDMLSFDHEWARIDARLSDNEERVIKFQVAPQGAVKSFQLDGVEKKRLPSHHLLPVVLFEPNHMLLLSGEPERRRAYLDTLLSHISPVYAQLLADYKRALHQRNKLLKEPVVASDHLFLWDVRLSELAGKLVGLRREQIAQLNQQLTPIYQSVSGTTDELTVSYVSTIASEAYANNLLAWLKTHTDLDKARGYTGAGPHRDDLGIWLQSSDARTSASRGETRSIVLSLKIAELGQLESAQEKRPLLLLDDVFSELDGKRRRMLATALRDYQTFITTTDADVVIDHFSQLCNIIPLENQG